MHRTVAVVWLHVASRLSPAADGDGAVALAPTVPLFGSSSVLTI
jgi:hypothetical protein